MKIAGGMYTGPAFVGIGLPLREEVATYCKMGSLGDVAKFARNLIRRPSERIRSLFALTGALAPDIIMLYLRD